MFIFGLLPLTLIIRYSGNRALSPFPDGGMGTGDSVHGLLLNWVSVQIQGLIFVWLSK